VVPPHPNPLPKEERGSVRANIICGDPLALEGEGIDRANIIRGDPLALEGEGIRPCECYLWGSLSL